MRKLALVVLGLVAVTSLGGCFFVVPGRHHHHCEAAPVVVHASACR